MSDVPQGPGWWQASDLKWYPPQESSDYLATLPPPPGQQSPSPAVQPTVATNGTSGVVWFVLGGLTLLAIGAAVYASNATENVCMTDASGNNLGNFCVSSRNATADLVAALVVVVIAVVGVTIAVRSHQPRAGTVTFAMVTVLVPLVLFVSGVANFHHGENVTSPSGPTGGGPSGEAGGSSSGPNKIIVNGQTLDMGQGQPRVNCYGGGGTQTLELTSASGQPRVEIDLSNNDILSPDSPMDVKSVTMVYSGHTFNAPEGEKANGEVSTTAKFVQDDRNWKVTGYVSGETLDHAETFEVDVTCP
jgi:hypothetical protein